jgi:hypothetical protein
MVREIKNGNRGFTLIELMVDPGALHRAKDNGGTGESKTRKSENGYRQPGNRFKDVQA